MKRLSLYLLLALMGCQHPSASAMHKCIEVCSNFGGTYRFTIMQETEYATSYDGKVLNAECTCIEHEKEK